MRILAIGDIHGCLHAFDALLDMVEPRQDDRVVALGDYVDRGPDSRGVLDRLLELRKRCRLVTLIGNHDLMMLAAREDADHFNEWLACGGDAALRSYGADASFETFEASIPRRHWAFLEDNCTGYYETDTHFFVHANVYPDMPLDEQPNYMLYWERLDPAQWQPHQSGKTMVCGHSTQKSGRPLVLERAVCIDTCVYGDGWLTCLDVQSEEIWQANQHGETRTGSLEWAS